MTPTIPRNIFSSFAPNNGPDDEWTDEGSEDWAGLPDMGTFSDEDDSAVERMWAAMPDGLDGDSFGDDYDPFDDMDPMEELMEGRPLDLATLNEEASQLLQLRAIEVVATQSLWRRLLLEAEMHMHSHRYREAMLCSLAVQQLIDDGCARCAIPEFQNEEAIRSLNMQVGAIQMISAYQMDDKELASQLMECIECTKDFSEFLLKRTEGTKQVFGLLPQLLYAVSQQAQAQEGIRDTE